MKRGKWLLEQVVDDHCWGQKCYFFSNPEQRGDTWWHMMAVTFWTGQHPPRGFQGHPGIFLPSKKALDEMRIV